MKNDISHYLSKKDPHLAKIIEILPVPSVESSQDVFLDLLSCIVGQQIHYRRTVPVFKKFLDLLANPYPTPELIFSMNTHDLISLKISQAKYETLLRLSEFWMDRRLENTDWYKLEESEIRKLLSEVKGIGNWTIDMILLYTLEKNDIFPFEDYHLKEIMVNLYGLNPRLKLKAQMLEIAEAWSPYKSWAVKYLLDWKEYTKKKLI